MSQAGLAPQPSSRVIFRSGSVPLPEWLDVAWFYPVGFRKEKIIETSRAWVVLGNEFVYKFLKVPGEHGDDAEFFRARWRLACEEVIDNRPLAPDLYVGLRLLRWIDNEPEWVSENPDDALDPLRPPTNADNVAIVMRRAAHDSLAHNLLESTGGLTGVQLFTVAESLREFHTRGSASPVSSYLQSRETVVQVLRAHYVEPLNNFILADASFLDPFTQIALEELRGFLSRFLDKHADEFAERLRRGAYTDCHGALRADRIAFTQPRRVSIFGRRTRQDPMRLADSLSDVAALAADFEARGYPAIAQRFEENYFRRERRKSAALYRFYKVAEAAYRAQALFQGAVDDRRVQATNYLSLALRWALNLDHPFLVVIGGTSNAESARLGRNIEALTSSQVLDTEALGSHWNGPATPEPMRLERLLLLGEAKFSRKQGAVLLWPLNREEERLQIQRFAASRKLKLLLVSLDGGKSDAGPAGRRIRSLAADFSQTLPELDAHHVLLEASLPQPELAMSVLRELK